jgi:hypothetical protein
MRGQRRHDPLQAGGDGMNDIVLRVGPAASGWSVDCSLLETTFFRSGARAEAEARRIAIELSGVGHDVRLNVHDRAEQVVATHRYFGA